MIDDYHLQMTWRGQDCLLKVYKNLPDWHRRIIGQWSGTEIAECDAKWKKARQVIKKIVIKQQTALAR